MELIREPKTGRRLLLIKFKKLSLVKMLRTLSVFTVGFLEDCYEWGQC